MASVAELMSLKGRRAVLTGAAGGLGRVMAETLAELGADLVLVDRPGADLASLAASLSARWPVEIVCRTCDLEETAQRRELVDWISGTPTGCSVLINNAAFVGTSGLTGWAVPFDEQSVETWRRAIEVNVTAAFDLARGLAPRLREARGAAIVNVASIYALYGPDWRLYEGTQMGNPAAYAVSKAGLVQLTRWLSTTLAPAVRVNAISPGGVLRGQAGPFVAAYEARTPLQRMATEDDFRGALAYLATDLSAYVTGHNLIVDGGWGVW